MAAANSVVGFLSGNVAYRNGDVGCFHCQIESDMSNVLTWSIDETGSKVVTGEMYNIEWYYPLANLIAGVGLSSAFVWMTVPPADPRPIDDVVLHLNLTFALDDNTSVPVSMTYENGEIVSHSTTTPLTDPPSNVSDLLADLTVMIDKAVTTCLFS